METVTIPKIELKNLLQETIRKEFERFMPKYDYVSNEEQKEIEKLHPNLLNDEIDEQNFVEL